MAVVLLALVFTGCPADDDDASSPASPTPEATGTPVPTATPPSSPVETPSPTPQAATPTPAGPTPTLEPPTPTAQPTLPPGCETAGTYQTVGQPFMLTWCTSCHHSQRTGSNRFGAPVGVNLETLQLVRTLSDRVVARAVTERTMPASGGPSEAEIERLRGWLECRAPGDENPLPSRSNDSSLKSAWEATYVVTVEPDFPEGLTVTGQTVGTDPTGRVGLWSIERYLVDGNQGWIVEREQLEADGTPTRVDVWDPPLLVYDAGKSWWDASSQDTITTAEGSRTEDQQWTVTVGTTAKVDPRMTDQHPTQVVAIEAGGLELGWYLSSSLAFTYHWFGEETIEYHQQTTVPLAFEGLPPFPLKAGIDWWGRILVREEAP